MSLRDAGLWTIGLTMGIVCLIALFELWKDNYYHRAYWSGRSDGWRASLEHQQKLERMKNRAVFDYEKN